ncbi:unnamed protein product [Allacma fusca]|uniref:Uncharacterized protein n=1 Tax=Allacma fusca TaxID=39272 RepID=A0A8J2JUG6_9HEXA|nr:unnamed protein product [Allacma fusca]
MAFVGHSPSKTMGRQLNQTETLNLTLDRHNYSQMEHTMATTSNGQHGRGIKRTSNRAGFEDISHSRIGRQQPRIAVNRPAYQMELGQTIDVETAYEKALLRHIVNQNTVTQRNMNSFMQGLNELHETCIQLQEENNVLRHENNVLTAEIRSKNLIISGIDESDTENSENLKTKVVQFLTEALAVPNIDVDVVRRLGQKSGDWNRKIQVQFIRRSESDLVYSKKKILRTKNMKIFIDRDIPKGWQEEAKANRSKKQARFNMDAYQADHLDETSQPF